MLSVVKVLGSISRTKPNQTKPAPPKKPPAKPKSVINLVIVPFDPVCLFYMIAFQIVSLCIERDFTKSSKAEKCPDITFQ
jgi:hypothetical protein